MKRASFLRALVALPAAVVGLAATSPVRDETPLARELRYQYGKHRIITQQMLLDIAEHHTGFRPARAELVKLPGGEMMDDGYPCALKFRVQLWDGQGRTVRKAMLISAGASWSDRAAQLGYSARKITQDAARELATMNVPGWDWRRDVRWDY